MAATEWCSSVGTIPAYNDAVTELATLATNSLANGGTFAIDFDGTNGALTIA